MVLKMIWCKADAFKFPPGSIIVFDKGYVDYQWFAQYDQLQKVSFVTRLRPKTVYQGEIKPQRISQLKGLLRMNVLN